MEDNSRNRLLALLVAVTALFAAVTVLVLFTTGSFGPVWFAASLLVYGTLGTVGVGLAVLEPTAETAEEPEPDVIGTASGDPIRLGASEVLYTTPTGRVLATEARAGEDARRLVFAVTEDDVTLVDDVERALDRLEIDVEGPADPDAVDAELARRGVRDPSIQIPREGVPVHVSETRTLYETEHGRLVWARYAAPDGQRETLFAVVGGQATPVEEVERRVDRLPLGSSPDDEDLQAALREHARPHAETTPEVTTT